MAERLPQFCGSNCYTAEDFRRQEMAKICSEGVQSLTNGDLLVTAAGSGLDINIAAGQGWINGDTYGGEGTYFIDNDATITKTLADADISSARVDRVIAQLNPDCTWTVEVLPGALGGGAPALPPSAISLATITVQPLSVENPSLVTSGDITDTRPQAEFCVEMLSDMIVTTNVYTSNDTWNAPSGLEFVFVKVVGGGGGGGGTGATDGTQNACAAGGGGGGYAERWMNAAGVGTGIAVTVGTGGAGGVGNAAGGAGNTSSFGGFLTAGGGTGGGGMAGVAGLTIATGGTGGAGGVAPVTSVGDDGGNGVVLSGPGRTVSGHGGGTVLGGMQRQNSTGAGSAGVAYGGGGSGAAAGVSTGALNGGAGAAGVVIVVSYARPQ